MGPFKSINYIIIKEIKTTMSFNSSNQQPMNLAFDQLTRHRNQAHTLPLTQDLGGRASVLLSTGKVALAFGPLHCLCIINEEKSCNHQIRSYLNIKSFQF